MNSPLAAIHIVQSLQRALDGLLGFLPNLLGFLAILIIGYLVARVVKAVIRKVLQAVGLDRALSESNAGRYVERIVPDASPANFIAAVVFWFIFIFVLSAAIGALKIPAVTTFMDTVLSYLPNVVAAVVIFVVAAAIAGAAAALVQRTMGDTPTGRIVRVALPSVTMAIAIFSGGIEIGQAIVGGEEPLWSQIFDVACGAIGGAIGGQAAALMSWVRAR